MTAFRSRAESLPASHLLYMRAAPGSEREDGLVGGRRSLTASAVSIMFSSLSLRLFP